MNKETTDQHVDEQEFQVNDVFALDVIVSTGDGKTKEVFMYFDTLVWFPNNRLQESVGEVVPIED